jgi:hypothetical protein
VLLVICGAGASHDAVPGAPTRPPLAAELFERRDDFLEALREIPAARSVVQRLRSLAPTGGGVEAVLGEFMSRAVTNGDPAYKRDAIALKFYLARIIERSAAAAEDSAASLTNYLALVTRLHDTVGSHVAYVTFNYDTMLENALNSRFGSRIGSDMASYLNGPAPVFKPHGSVNWTQALPALRPAPPGTAHPYMHLNLADLAEHADFDGAAAVDVVNPREKGVGMDRFYVPAIAAPVTDKDAFVMPDAHLGAMTDVLRRATRVLTIGWRGSELRFQETCREHLRGYAEGLRGLVVTKGADRSAGDETIGNLSPKLRANLTDVAYGGFTEFLETDALDAFARAG